MNAVLEAATRSFLARDACVVQTAPLVYLLNDFIVTHPRPKHTHPIDWISDRTRDSDPSGRGISRRRIAKLLRNEREFTDLGVADALLVAIGKSHALYDGTLEIVPSPHHHGCCRRYQPSQAIRLLIAV